MPPVRADRARDAVPRMTRTRLAVASRGTARIGFAVVLLSIALAVVAFVGSSLYAQYGPPRTEVNTIGWAERTLSYSGSDCAECHAVEAAAAARADHGDVICETCHPPPVHPGNSTVADPQLAASVNALCGACHAAVAGRPAAFAQVALVEHYRGAACLSCHEPHTAAAITPPDVTHPLAKLPACVTCHSPGGLKRFPAGHQAADDAICRTCHLRRAVDP